MQLNVPDRETRIFRAISEASATSVRAAAKLETIPRTTLRDRINGAQPTQLAHEKFLSLTPVQEKELVNLIILREKAFQPSAPYQNQFYASWIGAVYMLERFLYSLPPRGTSLLVARPTVVVGEARPIGHQYS
ncbi:hypothetical protein FOXYSP1_20444 [Fusarium oxysporum f. sp. phaseoli]